MRKILPCIALILMAGAGDLYGQFPASIGLKAGFSVANQTYTFTPIDYTIDTEPVFGPSFSLFVEAFKADHFSFQLDLGYALKGSITSTESVTVNHLDNDRIVVSEGKTATSTFNYLSLSPLARYRFGKSSLVPYFLLGPRMDILLKYNTDSGYPLDNQNRVILGLTLGTGLEYRLKGLGVFTELQYQGDLFPVTGRDPLLVNNHMISLTLGLRWIASY
jgi:hypothetical protein